MARKPNGPVTSSFSWPRHARSRAPWPRWFKAAATISTFLVLIMLPRAAWAQQRAKNDPHPEKPCVTTLSQTDTMRRVAFHPWCDLRELVRTFPVLNEAGKPLPMQEQLRNLYEANKDREVNGVKIRHTVMSGCTPTGSPSPDANEEERQSCSHLMNYYAAPANDSIAIIEVPRSRVLTYTEKLEKLSEKACTTLSKITNPNTDVQGALESCRKMGIKLPTQAAPIVVDEQPQSKPPQTKSSATPATSASSAPKADEPKEQPKQENATQVQNVGFFTILTFVLSLATILLALYVLFSSRKVLRMFAKHVVAARAKYVKRLAEAEADFERKLIKIEELHSHYAKAQGEEFRKQIAGLEKQNKDLEAKLQVQRSQPTSPPTSKLARANDVLAAALIEANAKVANLEAKLAQASTIVPTADMVAVEERIQSLEFDVCAKAGEIETQGNQISQLKKSLDTVTGERNQAQGKLEDLEREIGQIIQSRTASEARAEQTKANQTSVEDRLTAVQAELDELKCKTLVAEKDAKIAELEAKIIQNGNMPQLVAVSLRGHEETISRQGERIRAQVDELAKASERISELEVQLEQSQSDVKAKDLSLAEIGRELKKTEEDLGEVGEDNAKLVREKQSLEDELAALRDSTVKLAQDSPAGDSNSTVKLVETFDSTQDGKLTPEDHPQAKPDSVFTSLVRKVEMALGACLDQGPEIQVSRVLSRTKEDSLKEYMESDQPRGPLPTLSEAVSTGPSVEQLKNLHIDAWRPPAGEEKDTVSPQSSSPPPVDFDTMPDEILNGIFRSSLMQVGLRRLNGMRCFTFEVTGRDDIYRIHEAINAPLIWSINDQKMQHEFGSPRLLIDCQGLECRKPQSPMTKTAAMPDIGS